MSIKKVSRIKTLSSPFHNSLTFRSVHQPRTSAWNYEKGCSKPQYIGQTEQYISVLANLCTITIAYDMKCVPDCSIRSVLVCSQIVPKNILKMYSQCTICSQLNVLIYSESVLVFKVYILFSSVYYVIKVYSLFSKCTVCSQNAQSVLKVYSFFSKCTSLFSKCTVCSQSVQFVLKVY